jgi:predicted  nucleic acid-binding Zn-ribbon protein
MQVIASKDAEIEDLKKRLVATEKQLAEAKRKAEELEADLNKTKVCVRRMRGVGEQERVYEDGPKHARRRTHT